MLVLMRQLAVATVSLALGALGSWTTAQAQTYDSGGILRFGAFGQMSAINFDIGRVSSAGGVFAGSTSPTGIGAGIAAGYDFHFAKSWLIGVEVDGAIDNARSRADSRRGFNSDYFSSLRARFGVDLTRNWLVYGTAGYGLHGIEFRGLGGTNTAPGKTSTTQGGAVFGGGTEVDLDSYTLFAEVLHASYDTWSFKAPDVAYNYKVDDSATLFRLGVKFKIGYDYDHDIYPRNARRY